MNDKVVKHFGVLGMHWGVRRGSRSVGSVRRTVNGKTKLIGDLRAKGSHQTQKNFELEVARGILENRRSSRSERKVAEQIMKKHLTKAERKVEKAAAKTRNLQKQAYSRRQYAKSEIDYSVSFEKEKAKKSGKSFDEKKHRAALEKVYHDDLMQLQN